MCLFLSPTSTINDLCLAQININHQNFFKNFTFSQWLYELKKIQAAIEVFLMLRNFEIYYLMLINPLSASTSLI